MFDEYPDILTVKDIMQVLGIGKNKAYDMLKHNQIKNIKIGSNYKIPKTYLIEFIYKTVSV